VDLSPKSFAHKSPVEAIYNGDVETALVPLDWNVYSDLLAGELTPLAVLSEERAPDLPRVPTAKELGHDVTVPVRAGVLVRLTWKDVERDRIDGGRRVEELSRVGQQVLNAQPFSVLIGASLVSYSEGEAVIEVPVREELLQQDWYVHGGVIGYLTDNALTFAGGSVLGPQEMTQEYKINYLRPAGGEKLSARALVVSAGRRHAVCRCDVFDVGADGGERLCAAAQGTIASVAISEEAR
jgi:uncharacterized protein (TIGR00369 family)